MSDKERVLADYVKKIPVDEDDVIQIRLPKGHNVRVIVMDNDTKEMNLVYNDASGNSSD